MAVGALVEVSGRESTARIIETLLGRRSSGSAAVQSCEAEGAAARTETGAEALAAPAGEQQGGGDGGVAFCEAGAIEEGWRALRFHRNSKSQRNPLTYSSTSLSSSSPPPPRPTLSHSTPFLFNEWNGSASTHTHTHRNQEEEGKGGMGLK